MLISSVYPGVSNLVTSGRNVSNHHPVSLLLAPFSPLFICDRTLMCAFIWGGQYLAMICACSSALMRGRLICWLLLVPSDTTWSPRSPVYCLLKALAWTVLIVFIYLIWVSKFVWWENGRFVRWENGGENLFQWHAYSARFSSPQSWSEFGEKITWSLSVICAWSPWVTIQRWGPSVRSSCVITSAFVTKKIHLMMWF
jgi:hypothetical protein